jgi:hypothetical protein
MCVSLKKMARQSLCAGRGEAEEDQVKDRVDEAEERRADAVGDESYDDGQHCSTTPRYSFASINF